MIVHYSFTTLKLRTDLFLTQKLNNVASRWSNCIISLKAYIDSKKLTAKKLDENVLKNQRSIFVSQRRLSRSAYISNFTNFEIFKL